MASWRYDFPDLAINYMACITAPRPLPPREPVPGKNIDFGLLGIIFGVCIKKTAWFHADRHE